MIIMMISKMMMMMIFDTIMVREPKKKTFYYHYFIDWFFDVCVLWGGGGRRKYIWFLPIKKTNHLVNALSIFDVFFSIPSPPFTYLIYPNHHYMIVIFTKWRKGQKKSIDLSNHFFRKRRLNFIRKKFT